MRLPCLSLSATLLLSACIEGEMSVEVLGEDLIRSTGYIEMARSNYDMFGQDAAFCDEEGGELTVGAQVVRCDFAHEGTLNELRAQWLDDEGALDTIPEITALEGNRIRIAIPLGDMRADMLDDDMPPEALAMMQGMLAGLRYDYVVTGPSIESTTGTLSDDGTIARYEVTLDRLLDTANPMVPVFETIVGY